MGHAMNKRERLDQAMDILRDHPEGLTRAELARKLDVNRSTINKWLDNNNLPQVYEDNGKLCLLKDSNLARVTLHLNEITMLHIAGRLLVRQTSQHNPYAASALRKLSDVIELTDKDIGEHLAKAADSTDDDQQVRNEAYLQVLRVLTEARARKRKVTVEYEVDDGKWVPYTFSPYFIEPYAPGLTTHVIGFREPPAKIRTFKLERLRNADLSMQDAAPMPANFDPEKLLEYAWGIWYTDEEPELVELKFSKHVQRRVLETRWHRKQEEPQILEDGSVIWRCLIAEPKEMEYWVRGWGSDVEVLKPAELRERLISGVRKLAAKYQIISKPQDAQITRVLRCWGKTTSNVDVFHPAAFHMLDVGYVAQALLSDRASKRWKHVLSQALGADTESLITWLPWLIALHDIGKISATFQGLNQLQKARMEAEKFSFDGWRSSLDLPHAIVSQACIADILNKVEIVLPRSTLQGWEEALGGHHGRFVTNDVIKQARDNLKTNEAIEWSELRYVAAKFLKENLYRNAADSFSEPNNLSAATAALTGFAIVCDWLGSDSRFFTPQPEMEVNEYVLRSQDRAYKAVDAAGFFQVSTSNIPTAISSLFTNLDPLRPLQLAIDDIPTELLARPCLAIIEAPTGEGKTEAGLALAHRLAQASGSDEMYYALPTMATSNQMFGRLQKYLRDQLGLSTQIKLVHGQAFLVEDDLRIEPLDNGDGKSVSATMQWFSPKKRALLAPFGVGTIDQAELAALNVRHTALRLIGLAGKVIIIDEVHAYDTYMTTIIERLLHWFSALNTSVILLSATLPMSRRTRLVQAYGAEVVPQNQAFAAYPSLLIVGNQKSNNSNSVHSVHHASPTAWQSNRTLTISTLSLADDDPVIKAQWLLDKIAEGGCVCWITNTVKRAQQLCQALDILCATDDVDVMLLHAQFPLDDRQKLEESVAQKYGPVGNRPKRGIVIGTQVLEQSLDLDFDLMVSDLAPIDLLLQRAGRLHRHLHQRPMAHQEPRLWVNSNLLSADDLSSLGADAKIYDDYILRLTWKIILNHPMIHLPVDYRPLIEAVYDETEPTVGDPLKAAWDKLQTKQAEAMQEANLRLLPEPDAEWSFAGRSARMMFEESENNASWIVAQTRLGEESLNVIPLEVEEDQVRLSDDEWLSLQDEAPREIQLQLLRRSLRVSQYSAVQALKSTVVTLPGLFKKSALLKDYLPLLLHNHQAHLVLDDKITIFTLDPRLGLVIERQNRQKKTIQEEAE